MLPFTPEQFLGVFVAYNEGVWPAQWALVGLAVAGLLAARRGSRAASRAASGALALLWAWMALAYHFTYFSAINPVAWAFGAFFLATAIAYWWLGVVRARLGFRGPASNARLGWCLVAIALVAYPAAGFALGHRYPGIPSFGVPCPTTIFTLGLLHLASSPVPRLAFALPLAWCAVGSVAAFQLGFPQDFLLLAAGVASVPALFRRRHTPDVDTNQSHSTA
jgi:MFS superfamily sulfate permease-like transporter